MSDPSVSGASTNGPSTNGPSVGGSSTSSAVTAARRRFAARWGRSSAVWWAPGEAGTALAIAAALATLYVIIAASRGALDASRNDDWVYLRTAFHFGQTGQFVADPWSMAMLIGLVLLAAPVVAIAGAHIAPLHGLVAVLAAIGLWAAYLVVRSVLPRAWSLFAVGCLALGPIYGAVATSFMTDVPAFCFQMLALLAGVYALRADRLSIGWFAVALLAGLVAFSIREYSVAATVAVGLAALARAWWRSRRLALLVAGLGAAWLVVAGALYLWRSSLVDSGAVVVDPTPGDGNVIVTRAAVFTLALLAVPVLPLISLPRLAARLWARKRLGLVTLGVALLTLFMFWRAYRDGAIVGNYLAPDGSYAETIPGPPPVVIGPLAWRLLNLLAGASLLAVLAVALVRLADLARPVRSWLSRRSKPANQPDWPRTLILLYCLAAGGVLAAVKLFTSAPLFDRYLVPIVPLLVALVVRAARDNQLLVRPRRLVAAVSLGAFGLFGLGLVDNAATFDGAKWRLAQAVEQLGYPAESIDGGYEWYGLHQPGGIVGQPVYAGERNFWIELFDEQTVCATAQFAGPPAVRPPGGEPVILAERRDRSLIGVEYHVVAYAGPQACRPNEDGAP